MTLIDIRAILTERALADGDDPVVRGLDKTLTLTRLAARLDETLTDPSIEGARAARDLIGAMLALEASVAAVAAASPSSPFPVLELTDDVLNRIERHVAASLDNDGMNLEDAQAIGRSVASVVGQLAAEGAGE